MKHTRTAGDEAISGLFGGLIGGLGMVLLLVAAVWAAGGDALELLAHFNPAGGANPLTGALLHLATSGIYGIVFGLLTWLVVGRWTSKNVILTGVMAGIAYGVVLWMLARSIVLPAAASSLQSLPAWQFLAAHLVYGVLLGWWVGRGLKREA